ncbi:MAG: DUF1553 domain-containing protein [Planctomycetes bacterium]|nr:DUF1553 domain-containing protein [Planctomycetota bacterium]
MPRTLLVAFALLSLGTRAGAQELHARIDAHVEAKSKADGVPLSAPADDAEFVRRAYLYFAGRVPASDEAKAFLADARADKRAKLIDQLLAAPEYATRMTDLFHVMLMERLGDNAEWTKFLKESFASNAKWDVMVRKMLRADPKDAAQPGAAFWLAKRLDNYGQNPVDYSGLTRDVGRLFLGKNFQCCECHDHLTVDDYKQQHFQGLHTFFKNTYLASNTKWIVGEKPTIEKTGFASVFTKVQMATAPALPGLMMIDIPAVVKGMEFSEQPDRKTGAPGVLKFSPLKEISERLPTKTNADFTRNSANRVWFLLTGRGLVHHLDLHHSRNPPSHPELLDLLAKEFAARDFDIKFLLREIALSKTYQRSSKLPTGAKEAAHPKYFATALERRLTAEQLLQSVIVATGSDAKAADALRAKYVKAFANQPREPEEEVTPSLKAALFVLHDDAVLGLLKPTAGNLVGRAAKLSDADATDALYLALLSRAPSADERAAVGKVLAKHPDKRAEALGRVAWALLASMEFGVNH